MRTHHQVDRRTILELAATSDTDPRSVLRELRAIHGADRHVRGSAGERIRRALRLRGIVFASPPEARIEDPRHVA